MILDCTLRDGGYYTDWDFESDLIIAYLKAMHAAGVSVVELGFRSHATEGFRGACAYTSDQFLDGLDFPSGLEIGAMVNASDLFEAGLLSFSRLGKLFPQPRSAKGLSLVRIATHGQEFVSVLPAARWLADRGFRVGINLMQISEQDEDHVVSLAAAAQEYPVDVLYFADSLGCMTPTNCKAVVSWIRSSWSGAIGIHTHDNQGRALANTLAAIEAGATWADATVTGMGRGPGNARTEELLIEAGEMKGQPSNLVPLLGLIRRYFVPLKERHQWGTNPFYYLAGKHRIHPTFIQEMLRDPRYSEEDILAVINHLSTNGGRRFNAQALDSARHFYAGEPHGTWNPTALMEGREVLILGAGPGAVQHRAALEDYIRRVRPLVLALNTQTPIDPSLIDVRAACHPVRLLTDCQLHERLPQPLIAPASMLPPNVRRSLGAKDLLDYGIGIRESAFAFASDHAMIPRPLVAAYAIAAATAGLASRILMAGFDGYSSDDPRTREMQDVFDKYLASPEALPLTSVTPTRYAIPSRSIYAI